jgi:hypothetical protein
MLAFTLWLIFGRSIQEHLERTKRTRRSFCRKFALAGWPYYCRLHSFMLILLQKAKMLTEKKKSIPQGVATTILAALDPKIVRGGQSSADYESE